MTARETYINYVENSSKNFLRQLDGDRARRIENENANFYQKIKIKASQTEETEEVVFS